MERFARNLRERADELQLSHAEIARRCGLTERRFGHYVTGQREPDLATLVKICSTLGTTPNVLLGVEAAAKKDAADPAIMTSFSLLAPFNRKVVKTLIDSMIVEQRAEGKRRR